MADTLLKRAGLLERIWKMITGKGKFPGSIGEGAKTVRKQRKEREKQVKEAGE